MTRATWNDMGKLFDGLNTFVDVFGEDIFSGKRPTDREAETTDSDWVPRADVLEAADHVEIRAEIPGVTQKEIAVSVTNNVLTLKGEKSREDGGEVGNYHRVERIYGRFHRSFTLPPNLQTDNIKATFKDGVLVVSIPKVEEAKPKEINISVE